jgi:hypothetical protein
MILTIHCIRSFEYRNIKVLVLKDVEDTLTLSQLHHLIHHNIQTRPEFVAYRKAKFDTLRILNFPHGAKSNNLIDYNENGEVLELSERTLASVGIVDETEFSFYEKQQCDSYLQNPQIKW